MGAERAGVLAPTVQLSSELMEETTRNTSSFARKRIAVSHHSGDKRPFQQLPSCATREGNFSGDNDMHQIQRLAGQLRRKYSTTESEAFAYSTVSRKTGSEALTAQWR